MNEAFYQSIDRDMNHQQVSKLLKFVQHSMKNNCLISMAVKILPPNSIARSEGKAIRVIDHREKELIG